MLRRMLTQADIERMEPGTIFARGEVVDSRFGVNMTNSGKQLRWVAVRGVAADWAIYCGRVDPLWDDLRIKHEGEKVMREAHIRMLIPCTEDAYESYRF